MHRSELNIDPSRVKPRVRPIKALKHMRTLIADKEDTEQVFHIIEALGGDSLRRNLYKFAESEEGEAALKERVYLPPLLDDHVWLRDLPENTVGAAYLRFMEREGLSAQGLVDESMKMDARKKKYDDDLEWYGNRTRDTHDLYHVLTGYGRDALGEASLLAFTHGQMPNRGVNFISYVGIREMKKHLPREANVAECYREGKRNGRAAKSISAQNIIELLKEPIDEARARLNIAKPVAYKNALKVFDEAGMVATEIQVAAE
ncbi:MAG: Coq4 family protein [Pseudomonadota bacterium]